MAPSRPWPTLASSPPRERDALYRKEWVVYTKAPFKSPHALFRYLGLYTHPGLAISNHRLLAVGDDQIVFRTRDRKVCRLESLEFIRRFLQHVLPRGFVKIRHYGLLAPDCVNTKLVAARDAIAKCQVASADANARSRSGAPPAPPKTPPDWRDLFRQLTGIDIARCSLCHGLLRAVALPDSFLARAPPLISS